MAHHFTDQEVAAWLERRPKKTMSAKMVIYNSRDEVLIVKPNYKPGWFFVGGMVEANESPLQAAIRETQEEIGLALQPEEVRFVGMRYGVSKRNGQDYLHIIFCTTLSDELAKQVHLCDTELEDLQWMPRVEQKELAEHAYLTWRQADKTQQALYAEQDDLFVTSM